MTVALFVLVGILIAFGLYTLRARFRLLYGLFELACGVIIMLGAINSYSAALGRENLPIVGGGYFPQTTSGMATLERQLGCFAWSWGSDLCSRSWLGQCR
jgi:hypothetical protein